MFADWTLVLGERIPRVGEHPGEILDRHPAESKADAFPMSILAPCVDVLIDQIHPAAESSLPVNGEHFSVIPIVQDSFDGYESVESDALDSLVPQLLQVWVE